MKKKEPDFYRLDMMRSIIYVHDIPGEAYEFMQGSKTGQLFPSITPGILVHGTDR